MKIPAPYLFPSRGGWMLSILSAAIIGGLSSADEIGFDPVHANNAFTWDAFSVLQEEAPNENLVFSPFSIHQVMSMTYGAARTRTATELESVLHLRGQTDTHPAIAGLAEAIANAVEDDRTRIHIANRLWLQDNWHIEPAYQGLLTDTYQTTLERAGFAQGSFGQLEEIRGTINGWVAEQTGDRITELIPAGAFNNLTRWVLVNALALKAPFESPFNPDQTMPADFHVSGMETIDVRMMYQDLAVPVGSNQWGEGIALDLAGGSFSLVILLPREGVSLQEVVGELRAGSFALNDAFFSAPQRRYLYLPRFEVRQNLMVNKVFKSLGATAAFDPSRADFSGMTPALDAHIQRIDHEAFLTVAEGGIEAAAATSVIGGVTSLPPVFRVDRPFLFAVREKTTGTVLFAGQVHRPENPPDELPDWKEKAERVLGGDLAPAGNSWYESPLGRVLPQAFPWLYHENLGWLYVTGKDGDLWLYHVAGLGWVWTGLRTHYPVVYVQNWDYPWGVLVKDASGNLLLWNYATETYRPVP